MDILKKYNAEKSERDALANAQKSPAVSDDSSVRRFLQFSQDKIRDGRQTQYILLILSAVSIASTMFILFDFVASTPPRVDPLPIGAFPTLELRRRGAESGPPLAAHSIPTHEKKITIRDSFK